MAHKNANAAFIAAYTAAAAEVTRLTGAAAGADETTTSE
jgi:hypothetical protein